MGLVVVLGHIVDVVGGYQWDVQPASHVYGAPEQFLLLRQAVVLHLQEEIPVPQEFLILRGGTFCVFRAVP